METDRLYNKTDVIHLQGRQNELNIYVAIEEFPLMAASGECAGTMFTYSFLNADKKDDDKRPVLFAYNGGPGASSAQLRAGLLGPYLAILDGENAPLESTIPKYTLIENFYEYLEDYDVVMIDPLGTGYTQVFRETAAEEFYSIDGDAKAFARFIKHWLDQYHRNDSPKYLLGESYGTIRTCALANALMGGPTYEDAISEGIDIDGLILLGELVDIETEEQAFWIERYIHPMLLNMTSMAASNWFHSWDLRQKHTLREFVESSYDFAAGEMLTGMVRKNSLLEEEKKNFERKLSYYTGISLDVLRRHNYMISPSVFAKELLSDQNKELGIYDARFTVSALRWEGMPDPVADDPAMGAYSAPYYQAIRKIDSEILKIDVNRSFKIINFKVNGVWNYKSLRKGSENLQLYLRRSKNHRVLICSGLFDLCTLNGHSRYLMSQLVYDKNQMILKEYESGHMCYIGEESRQQLISDIKAFVQKEEMKSCY